MTGERQASPASSSALQSTPAPAPQLPVGQAAPLPSGPVPAPRVPQAASPLLRTALWAGSGCIVAIVTLLAVLVAAVAAKLAPAQFAMVTNGLWARSQLIFLAATTVGLFWRAGTFTHGRLPRMDSAFNSLMGMQLLIQAGTQIKLINVNTSDGDHLLIAIYLFIGIGNIAAAMSNASDIGVDPEANAKKADQ